MTDIKLFSTLICSMCGTPQKGRDTYQPPICYNGVGRYLFNRQATACAK